MKVIPLVCFISTLLVCSTIAQVLIANQQTDDLLRVTVPMDVTIAVDSSFLPTYGYSLLGTSSNGSNSGSNNNNQQVGSNSVADLTLARNALQNSNNNGHTGPLTNKMFVFQLQHVYQLQSNGIQWEQLVVGNESALNSVINNFSLKLLNESTAINPAIVAFNLSSPNNQLSNLGVIRRQDLINLINFSSGSSPQTSPVASPSANNGAGNNSVGNVADARSTEQLSLNLGNNNDVNDNINTYRVFSLATTMNNAFLDSINPQTRYYAHCYRASILDLTNGVEQDANVLTGSDLQSSRGASSSSLANIGANIGTGGVGGNVGVGGVGVGGSVGSSGVSGTAGDTSSSVTSTSSLSLMASSIALFGLKNRDNVFNGQVQFAYMKLIPQNINLTDNPLAGKAFSLRKGNFDLSQICVVMPRSNAVETLYDLEFGYLNGDADAPLFQGAFPTNSATSTSIGSLKVLLVTVAIMVFALFI